MVNYFERFEGRPNGVSGKRIHISLSDKGVIYLNGSAHALLGKPEAVALYFNKADSVIGLCSVRPDHRCAFPVQKNYSSYVVRANPFCRHYGISITEGAVVFENPQVDNQGILRLDLKTTKDAIRRKMKSR